MDDKDEKESWARGEFPTSGVEVTLLLVVSDLARSLGFYRDVLGAEVYREVRRHLVRSSVSGDLAAPRDWRGSDRRTSQMWSSARSPRPHLGFLRAHDARAGL